MTAAGERVHEQSASYGDAFDEVFEDLFPPDAGEAPAAFLHELVRESGPETRVVELGVGNGRVLLPLARLGHRCVGVDASKVMLDKCRAFAVEAGLTIETELADVRQPLDVTDAGLTLVVGATLGMFPAPEQDRVLATAAGATRQGGLVVVETHHDERVRLLHPDGPRSTFRFPRSDSDAPPITAESEFDAESGEWWLTYSWEGRADRAREFAFVRPVDDVVAAAARVGLHVVGVYGDWELGPLTPGSPTYVLVLIHNTEEKP